jgi:uncharacterized protein (DUF2235 family)
VARNIILLSDGTGNSAGKLFKTNVWRVYQALNLSNPSQIAHYDDGVGTSTFKPLAVIGGAFGWGLKRNLIDLYIFLCRNYAEGDQIYGFGFSRGAFTIRVLVKFVLSQGLVKEYISDDDLKRKAVQLYREFRKDRTTHFQIETVVRLLRDSWLKTWDRLYRPYGERKIYTRPVDKIKFLGLWDTVDAYGLPIEELEHGIDRYIWPLDLLDQNLDERIEKACHALSVDDQRTTFHPVLWDESDLNRFPEEKRTNDEVLTQVWFAGVHANIGGGYPDDGLSFVPLIWMIEEARKKDLVFNASEVEFLKEFVSPYGRVYNSRAALGAYYRYDPRRLDPPHDRLGATIPYPKIHESVIRRMAAGADAYAPFNLPVKFRVVSDADPPLSPLPSLGTVQLGGQNIHTFEEYLNAERGTENSERQQGASNAARSAGDTQVVNLGVLQQPDHETLEVIWDTVWWRKFVYFTAVAATSLLVGFPWLIDQFPKISQSGLGELFRAPVIFLVNNVSAFLPSLARPWVEAFETYPFSASYLMLTIALLLLWDRLLDRRIHNRAQAAWNVKWQESRYRWFLNSLRARITWASVSTIVFGVWAASLLVSPADESSLYVPRPESHLFGAMLAAFGSLFSLIFLIDVLRLRQRGRELKRELPGRALRLAAAFRSSRLAVTFWSYFTTGFIPAFFALLVVVGTLLTVNRIAFSFLEAGGWVCRQGGIPSRQVPDEGAVVTFSANDGCHASGMLLEKGLKYRVKVIDVDAVPGTDATKSISGLGSPNRLRLWRLRRGGIESAQISVSHYFPMIPLRRVLAEDWFTTVVRVGASGNQQYPLDNTYAQTIEPNRDGELFVYTNSPVLGLPIIWDWFYSENKGTVGVKVEVVSSE